MSQTFFKAQNCGKDMKRPRKNGEMRIKYAKCLWVRLFWQECSSLFTGGNYPEKEEL